MYQTAKTNWTVAQGYEVYMISATDDKKEVTKISCNVKKAVLK